jgi:hypothetical protein
VSAAPTARTRGLGVPRGGRAGSPEMLESPNRRAGETRRSAAAARSAATRLAGGVSAADVLISAWPGHVLQVLRDLGVAVPVVVAWLRRRGRGDYQEGPRQGSPRKLAEASSKGHRQQLYRESATRAGVRARWIRPHPKPRLLTFFRSRRREAQALLGGSIITDRTRRAPARLRLGVPAIALCAALIATAAGASAASARGLTTGFIDNSIFDPSASPTVNRGLWLDRASAADAGIIRITVDWRNRVREQPKDPTNPNDPAYGWAQLDEAVKSATAHGRHVLLTVYRAPDWAEGANPPKRIAPGAWKPKPRAYGQFAQALARRYSGHFHGLPRVSEFEAWTEPNLTQFLAPQWKGKKKFAPVRYRKLLNKFYAGVHAAQPKATVIAGATSPFGDSRKHQLYPQHPRMHPMVFLRTVLCLNAKLKRANHCGHKAHLDAVSAHPLDIQNGPHYKPFSKNDLQVANFSRVRRIVRAAKHAGTVRPKRRKPLWATESGMLSDPPNPKGAPLQKHARWIEESLYLLWKQGAKVVVNLNIRDPAYDPSHAPSGQFTTGVWFHGGQAKPAFRSFRFPFVTNRKSKSKVKAWGKAPASGKLKIQKKHGKRWHTVKRLKVRHGKVFTPTLHVRRHATLRARVGGTTSLSWRT